MAQLEKSIACSEPLQRALSVLGICSNAHGLYSVADVERLYFADLQLLAGGNASQAEELVQHLIAAHVDALIEEIIFANLNFSQLHCNILPDKMAARLGLAPRAGMVAASAFRNALQWTLLILKHKTLPRATLHALFARLLYFDTPDRAIVWQCLGYILVAYAASDENIREQMGCGCAEETEKDEKQPDTFCADLAKDSVYVLAALVWDEIKDILEYEKLSTADATAAAELISTAIRTTDSFLIARVQQARPLIVARLRLAIAPILDALCAVSVQIDEWTALLKEQPAALMEPATPYQT